MEPELSDKLLAATEPGCREVSRSAGRRGRYRRLRVYVRPEGHHHFREASSEPAFFTAAEAAQAPALAATLRAWLTCRLYYPRTDLAAGKLEAVQLFFHAAVLATARVSPGRALVVVGCWMGLLAC